MTATSYPFLAADHATEPIDLGQFGYIEQEYVLSGRANVYSWPGLPTVTVSAAGPYTTRILVRRPADPARASGNVRVEPLNPTSGHDLDAEWAISHDGFMHNGDVYIGVTIKPTTIAALKRFDPGRYNSLSMNSPLPDAQRCGSGPERSTETGLAWDILSQVGRLVKTDTPGNPLRGMAVHTSTMAGWSQSGSYILTYLNAIARHVRMPDGKEVFDGYLPGAGSYAGTPISQCAAKLPTTDERTHYNPPNGVPVIVVTTPTDFFTAASYNRPTDRPQDSDAPGRRIRLYEVGGGSHLPGDQGRYFPSDAELAQAGFRPENRIAYPLSTFPLHVVLNSAFANLDKWVLDGTPPPHAPRLTAVDPHTWPVEVVRDKYGNPVGGVPTPSVEVPIATYVERGLKAPQSSNSAYAGYDIAFSPNYLKVLYPTHDDYLSKVTTCVQKLMTERWLTDYDGAQIIAEAQNANVPGI